jgi:sugar-specific transcriptional regulator TrmB
MKDLATVKDYWALATIGLSKTQAECYGVLAEGYGLSAKKLATKLGVSSSNLYRVLKDLRVKGFITEIRIVSPTTYRVVPLSYALVNYAEYQRQQVKQLIARQEQTRQAFRPQARESYNR